MAHRKVLILDDDYELLETLTLLMEHHSYNCITLSDLEDINLFNSIHLLKPNLILLDINFGSIDGIDLCQKIKVNALTAHYKVVLMSVGCYHAVEDRSACDYFIQKPFDNEQLLQTVMPLAN